MSSRRSAHTRRSGGSPSRSSTSGPAARTQRTTRADLRTLLADLPATSTPRPRPREAHAWQVWASVAIVLLVVWAATGAGAFWPVWPLGFWALGLLLGRGAPHRRWERTRV